MELRFLRKHELCKLAIASKNAIPHVTPVIYTLDGDSLVIAVDYGTKKLRHLKENKNASLVVDDYNPNRVVVIQENQRYTRMVRSIYAS